MQDMRCYMLRQERRKSRAARYRADIRVFHQNRPRELYFFDAFFYVFLYYYPYDAAIYDIYY